VIGSLIGWRLGEKRAELAAQNEQRSSRSKAPAMVSVASAELRDIVGVFEATGSVEAPLSVKIAPKITGRISFLEAREGDHVRRGQVLARIDSTEVEAGVQQQMAAVAEARYRLAQAQMNENPTDVGITAGIRQQSAALSSAKADLAQVQENYQSEVAAAQASVMDAQSKVAGAKASLASAQASLDNARTRYNRLKGLYEQGFIAAQDVDDSKAALTVQESALSAAQAQVDSAAAQRDAAAERLSIAKTKGKADIEAAKAKVSQVEASLDHANASTSGKAAYRQSLAALRASVTAAEAGLASAKAKRGDTVLVSPLDGVVTGRHADPGAIASPTQPVLSVQFVNQVWVTVSVPEDVCAKLHIGQPSKITFDALPEKVYSASVVQINPSADPDSRQFTVRVIMENKDGRLKPGMFGHVALETERVKSAIAVPREAVQRGKEGTFVVAVGPDKKAKRVPVAVGVEDDTYVALLSGVAAGEKVVTMSATPVRDGQTIVAGGKRPRGGKGRR
jgi:RND family efflux transporter MFP subunit